MPAFPSASRRLATRGSLLFALAMLFLVVPAAAQAATRYAAPGAVGAAPCAAANPCPIGTAVDLAEDGDEISLAGGTYELSAALDLEAEATLHGPGPGAGSAVLDFAALGPGTVAVNLDSPGVTVRDLTIEGTDGSTLLDAIPISDRDRIERVRVLARGDSTSAAMLVRSGTMVRDTVVWQEGVNAALAVATTNNGTDPVDLVNVTAVGWEGLTLYSAGVLGSGELRVRAVNSVFGITDGGYRGILISNLEAKPIALEIDHSNTAAPSVTNPGEYLPGAGMQSQPPLFVDAAAGDFRQLPNSPTVDAGTGTPPAGLGPADLAGNPRLAGAAVDIGADELQLPEPPASGTAGSPTGPSSRTAPRRARLSIKSAGLMPRSFAMPGRGDGAVSRLRIRLSAPATVTFAIERLFPPRRGHGRDCVGPRPAGNPCSRFRRIAALPARALPAGRTTLPFNGRVHGRPLRPGRYRLRLIAHGRDGQRSRFRYVAFWVKQG
ncbi:MAG TPA: choice-of-anchor Q domain-containing protein [Solirubrobacterales bacterium]|nr:choice-of-anchor Q domain-containing protein [Solirubrobacterales bacterium]